MIHMFRASVPPDVYRMMVREYFELHRILDGLSKHQKQLEVLRKDSAVTELMLALTIFYRNVIAPFEGAGRVMQQMRASNVSVVRMGQSKLDDGMTQRMDLAVRQFYGLVMEFRVPKAMFVEHDIKNFARLLSEYLKAHA